MASALPRLPLITTLLMVLTACDKGGDDEPPTPPYTRPASGQTDLRSYMHGIEAIQRAEGRYLVFFSSSSIPPTGPDQQLNWTHDVYVSDWTKSDAHISLPRIFIQRPEAQEPVSVAQTTNGHIMITFEDGWNTPNGVNQRYGVYTPTLQPIAPYPLDVASGGHSGHVAAVGNYFVVFYSEGWTQGGGVDNLGTGNGVYAKVYDSAGRAQREIDVASNLREWWPMIAGSPTRALLVWQQFVSGEIYANLIIALLDPKSGTVTGQHVLQSNLQYYTYKAEYVPAIDRFIVTGTTNAGKGFAYLINKTGQITAKLQCMPATVREAGIAVNGTNVYTPSQDNRLLHLALTPSSISLVGVQKSPIQWSFLGSVGLMRNSAEIHWVSLSEKGIQEAAFKVSNATLPSAADRCE